MNLIKVNVLRGINVWTTKKALQAVIEFNKDELQNNQTSLIEQINSYDIFQGIDNELNQQGAVIAQLLALITLKFQQAAGYIIDFFHVHKTDESGIYKVVVEYIDEEVGRFALNSALDMYENLISKAKYPLHDTIDKIKALNNEVAIGPSTLSIISAAVARNIPYCRITHSLIQVGYGKKQRYFRGSELDSTSSIAEEIAQDKELTRKMLGRYNLPVPKGGPAKNLDEAWSLALDLTLPVVLKPRNGNQGKGVTVNINSYEEFVDAYKYATHIEPEVLVETFIPGNDYRLLVVGTKVIAASHRTAPTVIGDGIQTIQQIVDKMNLDPQRGMGHAKPMTYILIDDLVIENLKKKGLSMQSILPAGDSFVLRNNANLSSGGSAADVTDQVHPEIAALVVEAAQIVQLSPCGIDFVCESISKPLSEQKGAIIELNASPGLRMHLHPSSGTPRLVGEALIEELFPLDSNGRIPVVTVTGTNGKTTTVRLISHILGKAGYHPGMTNSDGIYVNQKLVDKGDCSGPKSAKMILCHPDVDAAVLETARGGILREGLAFDMADVAVVTNIGEGDHLGLDFIYTVEELALVKQTVVTSVAPWGTAVLNAEDRLVANMLNACKGDVIFFAFDKENEVLASHLNRGKRCIYVENQSIVAQSSDSKHTILLSDAPLTMNGAISFQVQNVMAAIGAAWSLGISWTTIKSGINDFLSNHHQTPGRFNQFTYRSAKIIADYGHNPDAIKCLVSTTEKIQANKKVAVVSVAGDRLDSDFRSMSAMLGDAFDHIILYEERSLRGREPGETIRVLKEGLSESKRARKVDSIWGEQAAIEYALNHLEAQDLCLIILDNIEKSLLYIQEQIQAIETNDL